MFVTGNSVLPRHFFTATSESAIPFLRTYESFTLPPSYITSNIESRKAVAARHGRCALWPLKPSPVLPETYPSRSHVNTRSDQWPKTFACAGEVLTCAGARMRWLTYHRVSALVTLELEVLTLSSPHSKQDRRTLSNSKSRFFLAIFQHINLRFRDRMELHRAGLLTSTTCISRTSQYRRISSVLKHH